MGEDNAAEKILAVIDQAEENGQRVVTHCTGGVGRSGRVAAAWLVHRYGLSPEEATKEVLEMAATAHVNRKGSAELLEAWLA
jgi:protein-tyrosine phosphatase